MRWSTAVLHLFLRHVSKQCQSADDGEDKMDEIAEILTRVDERLSRIEEKLDATSVPRFEKEWYTVPEAAEILGKQPFTIREWCRLHRIGAKKRKCGRGRTTEWVISTSEIERYLNEGLLPQQQ